MNERIKELAQQCYDPGDILTSFEKFAKLIAQECIVRAEREWIRNGSDTEHNQAVSNVIDNIKQHFGIEE